MSDLGYQNKLSGICRLRYNESRYVLDLRQESVQTHISATKNIGVKVDRSFVPPVNSNLFAIENEYTATFALKRVTQPGETPKRCIASERRLNTLKYVIMA